MDHEIRHGLPQDYHEMNHVEPHRELHRVPADLSQFWVITILSNPVRYKKRYDLYWKFAEMCEHAGVNLVTVEQAFGNRKYMVTSPNNKYHLQVRTVEELWHKENMINLGIRHARVIAQSEGRQVREVAWVDADVYPTRTPRDWFEETWHQLQHYQFVQMFDTALDLGPDHSVIGETATSFISRYHKSGYKLPIKGGFWDHVTKYYSTFSGKVHGHPGYAWAANIDALDAVGGILDFAILGAGDRHMALGLVGAMPQSFESKNPGYVRSLYQWQVRAERWIKRDVGIVPGSIFHYWHGPKKSRGYTDRWKILIDNKFNPDTDLKYDHQGLLQLETWNSRQIMLRDQIRSYFRSRNEDSIDL